MPRAPAGSRSLFPSEQRKHSTSTRQMLPATVAGFFSDDVLSEMIRRDWEGDLRRVEMTSESGAARGRELTAGFPMQRSEMSWQRMLTAMQRKVESLVGEMWLGFGLWRGEEEPKRGRGRSEQFVLRRYILSLCQGLPCFKVPIFFIYFL
jgi:hypothetical protein